MQRPNAPSIFERDPRRFPSGFELHGCHPVNSGTGGDFYVEALATPLRAAFPRGEERTDIALRGIWRGQHWTARSGHIAGLFEGDLFGIPASGRVAFLRFGRFDRFDGGELAESIVLLDLPSLMIAAGLWPLAPPLGPDPVAPAPRGHAGLWPQTGDGAASLALVEAMIGGLMRYDGSLAAMNMRDFFAEDFWWFGPAPIGSFRGFADYERGHAMPFLNAFPDRVGGNHRARFGDGAFIASTGWPSITATHKGDGWLGTQASHRPVTMRVMDFWHAENGRLIENWVMIDIPDLLNQIGIDVFAALPGRN